MVGKLWLLVVIGAAACLAGCVDSPYGYGGYGGYGGGVAGYGGSCAPGYGAGYGAGYGCASPVVVAPPMMAPPPVIVQQPGVIYNPVVPQSGPNVIISKGNHGYPQQYQGQNKYGKNHWQNQGQMQQGGKYQGQMQQGGKFQGQMQQGGKYQGQHQQQLGQGAMQKGQVMQQGGSGGSGLKQGSRPAGPSNGTHGGSNGRVVSQH